MSDRLADIRALHYPAQEPDAGSPEHPRPIVTVCYEDAQRWPCEVGSLLDALDAAIADKQRQHDEIVEAVHALCEAVDVDVARPNSPKTAMFQMIEIARQTRSQREAALASVAALRRALERAELLAGMTRYYLENMHTSDAHPDDLARALADYERARTALGHGGGDR